MGIGEEFEGRFDFHAMGLNGRAYLHKLGFKEAFGNDFLDAVKYVRDVTHEISPFLQDKKLGGCVGIVWGHFQDRVINFFGYGAKENTGRWKGNTGIYSWEVRNGVIFPGGDPNVSRRSLDDGVIVLAQEIEYRRSVSGDDYAAVGPEIDGLNAEHDFSVPGNRFKLLDLQQARETARN